ncbi:hypothetical protein [Cronobacter dublinensis]|uniref:hypothetical protein n=1 Tax=Cronobacter dublinensis TaxID=413497 RepID=UPI000CFDBFD9|nr:hypothetical protein [Cronobacter dublinensis]
MKRIYYLMPFHLLIIMVSVMVYGKDEFGCYNKRFNKSKGLYSYSEWAVNAKDCLYEESDEENEKTLASNFVQLNLAIKVHGNDLFAVINLKNNSDKDIYIWKGQMLALKDQLSGDFFNILCDGIKMDYLGSKVNFGSKPDSISDYISIAPEAIFQERIRLNGYYQFLPGKHVCNIGTKYFPVTHFAAIGSEYKSPDPSLWIRSTRVEVSISGNSINDKAIQYYTVR